MRTAKGRRVLQHIHATTPQIPWSTDVDSHAQAITQHLQMQLALHFPLRSAKPRQPTISDDTWACIRLKRHSKRVGRRVTELLRRETLQYFFAGWAHHSRPCSYDRQKRLRYMSAQCHSQTLRAVTAYRKLLRRDCAEKARTLFFEARGKGPEAMAHHLRCLTKTGRRFKPLPTQPCLINGSQASANPLLDLGHHFAADEKGHLCTDFSELAARPKATTGPNAAPLCRQDVISMPQLAVAFATLNNRKGPGLTGLPPEAFSFAAPAAAQVYWPLYLKATVRQQAPIIWRGGRVVPINKPQKAFRTRAAWRSILLMEASAKAICSAARPVLLQGFSRVVQPAQGGSRQGSSLHLPMAYAQATLDYLVRQGRSGGLIFFDGKAAFYATFREIVLGQDALHTAHQLDELARLVSDDPHVQEAFLAGALGPGLLQTTGVPDGLRQFLASTLSQTWFLSGRQSVFVTKTGTMPGAPLADLVFQFAFAHFLKKAHTRLCEAGLSLTVVGNHTGAVTVPSPTWMDDIVVPVDAPDASSLVPRVQSLVRNVALELANIGIQVNTGPGKSEALLHFAGHGSRKVRHHWLVERNAVFEVELSDGASSVMHIVASYTHLGSAVSFDRTPQLDIKRRAAAARDARRRIHRPILTNAYLSVEERLTVHWSIVIRKFLHGAGLWTFRLGRDFQCFSAAYLSLIRPICLPVLGVPAKGLDDDSVCAICGFPSAKKLRDLELATMASAVGSRACPATLVLLTESTWLTEVANAWKRICDVDCQLTPDELLLHWQANPQSTLQRYAQLGDRVDCSAKQIGVRLSKRREPLSPAPSLAG